MMKILPIILCIFFSLAAYSRDLTLREAQAIAKEASEYAAKKQWKISIAVVNREGSLIYYSRDDGAMLGSTEMALSKAKCAASFRRPTSAFVEMIKAKPSLLTGPGIVAVEGGVPILSKDQFLGALGISGATALEDEEIALAALQKFNRK